MKKEMTVEDYKKKNKPMPEGDNYAAEMKGIEKMKKPGKKKVKKMPAHKMKGK